MQHYIENAKEQPIFFFFPHCVTMVHTDTGILEIDYESKNPIL